MFFYSLFFNLFGSLALLSAFLMIVAKNPVFSVFFLILVFSNISALLFLLNIELLPIIFLLVYVGAIAVLFLFVLMTMNINRARIKSETNHFLIFFCIILFIFLISLFLILRSEFTLFNIDVLRSFFLTDLCHYSFSFENALFLQNESNIRLLGRVLFLKNSFHFVILGYALLLAMIAAIILTLNKQTTYKAQNVYFQILKKTEQCLFLYR